MKKSVLKWLPVVLILMIHLLFNFLCWKDANTLYLFLGDWDSFSRYVSFCFYLVDLGDQFVCKRWL